jgi:hypothetical protein
MRKEKREHKLMMVGYNQAMLDWAKFPVVERGEIVFTYEQVKRIVERLQSELSQNSSETRR